MKKISALLLLTVLSSTSFAELNCKLYELDMDTGPKFIEVTTNFIAKSTKTHFFNRKGVLYPDLLIAVDENKNDVIQIDAFYNGQHFLGGVMAKGEVKLTTFISPDNSGKQAHITCKKM